MKQPHLTTWLVLGALCVAVAAHAAGERTAPPPAAPAASRFLPAPAPPPPGVQPGEGMEDGDELAFLADDDVLAAAPGAGADEDGGGKHMSMRGMTRHPGGGGEDAEGCGPGCGCMMHRGGRPGGMGGPGMRGPGMGMPGMMGGGFGAKLQLTDAQREKLADIHDRQLRRGIQARSDLAIAQLDLHKAMRSEKPDAGAIDAQIDRIAKVRTDLAKARVAGMLEARAVLTPEQQKLLHEGRGRWHGEGRAEGGGTDGGARGSDTQGTHPGHRMHGHGQPDSTGSNSQ